MRFLIVAASVLACAVAAPSGALLAGAYGHGLAGLGHGLAGLGHGLAYGHGVAVAPVAVGHAAVAPTIPPGDIQGAAIDAHVNAADHVRASVDATREWHDQAAEVQGQAVNAAQDHAWASVNAAQTAQAQIDGAAAGVAPVVAKQLAGHGAYVAPVAAAAYAAPVAVGHGAWAAPAAHGAWAAPAAHGAWAAPAAVVSAGSHSVATSSLSQTHPAPIVHAPVAYAAHGYAGHGVHGW